jgi:chromosome segregation ATPase
MDAENARLLRARSRQEEAEQEQTRLAQLEDFEGADALSAVVDQCGVEMRASEAALRDLTVSVRMLEQTFSQERADSINGLRRMAATLKATKEQLVGSAAQMQSATEKQSAVELARITAELERIGLEKGHFEREETALSSDSERTEEAIRSQTGDLSERKLELQRAVGGVEEEIRALQEQLAAKMAERSSLSADLDQVEGRIGEVRKKYDRQLHRIADRQAALRQSKQECLQEEGAVLADQAALCAQSAKDNEAAQQVLEWAVALELDTTVLDAFLANLSATAQSASQIASISSLEAAGGDDGAEALRKNLEAILFLTTKKHAVVGELRARCDALLTESRRLGEQIPQLEAEKKAHAAAKRFKEAAAVAKDLKDVQSAKEIVDAKVTSAETSIAHTLGEIDQLAAQQVAAETQLAEAQRKRDVDRFDNLLVRAKEVRGLQTLVRKHARATAAATAASIVPVSSSADSNAIAQCSATPQAVQVFLAVELGAVLREAAVVKERYGLAQSLEEAVGSVDDSEGEEGGEVESIAVAVDLQATEAEGEVAHEGAPDPVADSSRGEGQPESGPTQGDTEGEQTNEGDELLGGAEQLIAAEPDAEQGPIEVDDGSPAAAPQDGGPPEPECDRAATILLAKVGSTCFRLLVSVLQINITRLTYLPACARRSWRRRWRS